jgi:hypothetical protein
MPTTVQYAYPAANAYGVSQIESCAIVRVAFVLVLYAFAASCAAVGYPQVYVWKEEVKLSDGRHVWVQITHRMEADIPILERATLEVLLDHGATLKLETCARPIALDFVEGVWIVVGSVEFSCRRQYGFTDRGYVAWKSNGAAWNQLSFGQVPSGVHGNLTYNWKEARERSPISIAQKVGELHVWQYDWSCDQLWKPGGDPRKCSRPAVPSRK